MNWTDSVALAETGAAVGAPVLRVVAAPPSATVKILPFSCGVPIRDAGKWMDGPDLQLVKAMSNDGNDILNAVDPGGPRQSNWA